MKMKHQCVVCGQDIWKNTEGNWIHVSVSAQIHEGVQIHIPAPVMKMVETEGNDECKLGI